MPDRKLHQSGEEMKLQAPRFCQGNIIPASANRTISWHHFTYTRLQHDDGLGSCLRSIPGAPSRPRRALSPRRCVLARRQLSSPGEGSQPVPARRRGGVEVRAAPGAGAGGSRPRVGRRERTSSGCAALVPTPRGGPGAARSRSPLRFPPSLRLSLPPSFPPPSPPLLQNRRSCRRSASLAPVPAGDRGGGPRRRHGPGRE